MEKIFEVLLKDDEVLGVYWGINLLGVIIRPTIEKILSFCNRFEKSEDILNETLFQETDIIIGVYDVMETTFTVGYETEMVGEELIRMSYENFNLEIIKILI